MKEIKFRGKRLDNGAWEYGDLVQFGQKCHTPCKCAIIPGTASGSEPLCKVLLDYEVNPATIGQYTGLKDKSGRKIYEGDIVEHEYYHSNRVVKWDEDQAKFDGWYKSEEKHYRIIGNIHDNPELLKGGEQ